MGHCDVVPVQALPSLFDKRGLLVAVILFAVQVGCVAAVRGTYGPYDTSQCYWTWIEDGYGGYEQLRCWAPGVSSYDPFVQGGAYVRRYPTWYTGQHVAVTPPIVGLVHPRGVVVAPPPMAVPAPRPPMAVPAPH